MILTKTCSFEEAQKTFGLKVSRFATTLIHTTIQNPNTHTIVTFKD